MSVEDVPLPFVAIGERIESEAPRDAVFDFADVVDVFRAVEWASREGFPACTAQLEEAGEWEGLLRLGAALDEAKERIGFAAAEVALALYRIMPGKIASVEGVGSAEKKSGTTRKAWEHQRIAARLAARVADERRVDLETGEIDETPLPPAELAMKVADEIVSCAGVSYWRTTALRGRGLDPADYCEEERGRPSVIIRRASASAASPRSTVPEG